MRTNAKVVMGIGILLAGVATGQEGAPPPDPDAAQPAAAPAEEVAPAEPAGAKDLTGTIQEVTVYQGTALVTRAVELPAGPAGPFEVVVSPLPTATDPASVFADKADGVEIRSVACRSRPPAEAQAVKGQVAKLDDQIRELTQKIANSRNEIALRRIRQDYLRGLERFVAPAAMQEMTHGVLQAEELEKVTKMHFTEYETASQEIMKLDVEIEADSEALGVMKKEREKLAAGPPVTYDAILYLERPEAGAGKLNLNYLVKDCGWSPVYNVRGDSAQGQIEIEFNALIHQVSGETWERAKLSLSTASPTVSAYNPQLAPLYVRMTANGQQQGGQSGQVQAAYTQARAGQKAAIKDQYRGQTVAEAADANYAANESAASVQLIELSERMSELRRIQEDSTSDDLSIEYDLQRPVTIVSRRQDQMVPVLQHKSAAKFYHVAVPILTPAVFREAELVNATRQDLLGGKVNVYLDGRFTGRTEIPSIARGRNFTLGFGVDGRLRARRSLVDRRSAVQGGNQQVEISVEVVVDNYADEPVKLRVRERTPTMEDTASLRVALGELSQPLSTDADYQRFERPKGILLWDLEVKPGSGKDATSLRYDYSLEFDKSLTLQDITREQKTRVRTEFIQQSKRAFKK
ncbi:MAG: DUF4139 domain-containing protein [Akkermansiaceae bacterium]|nr:DUF4139 domain-containing protein [Akkermansiaceae bacterium]NNM29204.1 DUF4139 domain-containing protein [Akkermansiaceae bacterium]